MDLEALGEHLALCKGSNRRLLALRSVAETMNGFVAARFMTTLVLAILLLAGASILVL